MLPKHKRLNAKKDWNKFVKNNESNISQLVALVDDPVKTPERYRENFQKLNQIMTELQSSTNLMLVQDSALIKISRGENVLSLFQIYEIIIHYYFEFYLSEQEQALEINPALITEFVSFLNNLSKCSLHISAYHESFQLLAIYLTNVQCESSFELELLRVVEELFNKVIEQSADYDAEHKKEIKSHIYVLMLSVYMLLYQRQSAHVSWAQISAFFERSINQKIELFYESYVDLLQLLSLRETPNFIHIGYAFGKVYGHVLRLKSTDSLDVIANGNFIRAVFSCYGAVSQWAKRIEAMEHKEPVLKKEALDYVFFIYERIISLESVKLPSLSLKNWYDFFSVLIVHKPLLSEKQQEKIYQFARYTLNNAEFNSELSVQHTLKNELLILILSLMANTKNPCLKETKRVFDAFQFLASTENGYQEGYDELIRILLKAKQLAWNEFDVLFELVVEQHLDKKNELLLHAIRESTNEPDCISFINKNIKAILKDKVLYNELLQHFDLMQFNQLEQGSVIIKEYEQYHLWQNFKEHRIQEVKASIVHPSFKKAKQAYLAFLQLEGKEWYGQYLPSELMALQQPLWDEFIALNELIVQAKTTEMNANRFILEFVNTVQQKSIDLQRLVTNRMSCGKEVEYEKAILEEAKAQYVGIEEAREWGKGNNREQLERINRSFVVTPHSFESHYIKINALIKLEYYNQALVWLEHTAIQFPGQKNKGWLIKRADCYKALGYYYEALRTYEQILELTSHPLQQGYTKLNMAWCHQKLGTKINLSLALMLYDMLLSENTSIPRLNILQAKARCLIEFNQFAAAQELLNTFIELEDARTHALFAMFHYQQKQYKEAVMYYKKALAVEKNPGWVKALLNCYMADPHSNKKEIHTWMRQLLQDADDSLEGRTIQVAVHFKMKCYAKALELLDLISQENGYNEHICVQKARCYRELGQIDRAIAELNWYKNKNQMVLNHLALTYSLMDSTLAALSCYDYLLAEYPLFIKGYVNAFAYCIKIQDMERLKWYWHLYQEQFGNEVEAIPEKLYSSLQYYLSNRTLDEYLPLVPEELDAFIIASSEDDEGKVSSSNEEITVSADMPHSIHTVSDSAKAVRFFIPQKVQDENLDHVEAECNFEQDKSFSK